MSSFSCQTRIFTGEHALDALSKIQAKRVLLVTDRFFVETGVASKIADLCVGAHVQIFDRVKPDPDLLLVTEGIAQIKTLSPDWILALGGGSPIDCAKAMRFLAESDAKLAVIPTTSGTGSEVTSFSIITNNSIKLPLVDDALLPDLAILDPSMLTGLPRNLIADTGFDVLSHCAEAVAATEANSITDAMAIAAFKTVQQDLLSSWRGDISVRIRIHEAACMAGMAFNYAGLGVCHALSHALGGQFHIPHGRLNAVLLPHVIQFNAENNPNLYDPLAQAIGASGASATIRLRYLINCLKQLRKSLSLPETLAQCGIEHESLHNSMDQIVTAAEEDRCIQTNPRPCRKDELQKLLLEAAK